MDDLLAREIVAEMKACADRLADHAMSPDLDSLEAGAHARAGSIVLHFAERLEGVLSRSAETAPGE